MATEDIFAEEWRDCLRAHYSRTVHEHDEVTLRTLVPVMHEVGFTEDELREMYVHATMHVDDVGPDFMPNLSRAVEPEASPVMVPVTKLEPPPTVPPVEEQPTADENAVEAEEDPNRYIPPPAQQLSLF